MRGVIRYDLTRHDPVEYRSIAEAARANFCSVSTIRRHCNGWTAGPFEGKYRFNWGRREK